MSEEAKKLPVAIIILLIIFVNVVFGFALFFLSGNLLWMEAWIFLIIMVPLTSFAFFWLNKHNPQVMRSRASVKGLQKEDVIIMSLVGIVFFTFGVVVVLDGGRYHWSTVPLWGETIGFIGLVLGYIITILAMKENAFAAKFVRVDKEGGHKVITTGPYAVVRHPLYAGALLLFSSGSIALGSLYGLIPVVFLIILLLVRISFEEKFLHEELDGYTEYTKKVKKRLIPWIW
jgi:protein-S-isoprenylcysteine O-methyltransferase Ste14